MRLRVGRSRCGCSRLPRRCADLAGCLGHDWVQQLACSVFAVHTVRSRAVCTVRTQCMPSACPVQMCAQLTLCGHDKARWCEPRADGARDLATCSSHSVALLSAQLAKASEPSAHMAQYSLKILCSWREVCRGGRPSSAQAALRRLVPVREQSAPQASCMCMHMSCACTCYMCMCMSMCRSM